jgi:hypothetical protein
MSSFRLRCLNRIAFSSRSSQPILCRDLREMRQRGPGMVSFGEYARGLQGKPTPLERTETAQLSPLVPICAPFTRGRSLVRSPARVRVGGADLAAEQPKYERLPTGREPSESADQQVYWN